MTTEIDRLGIAEQVLLRCWIIGIVLLTISVAITQLAREPIATLHSSMFGLTDQEIAIATYCILGLFKILITTFFFVPWLSIKLLRRS